MGNLERDAGDVEAAIRRHITANARKPGTPAILWALAEDYALAGRVDECLRALDDLSAQAPNGREALAKKREVYEAAGRLEEAIETAQALLRAGTPDDGSLNNLRLKAAQQAPTPESARMHLPRQPSSMTSGAGRPTGSWESYSGRTTTPGRLKRRGRAGGRPQGTSGCSIGSPTPIWPPMRGRRP